MKKIMILFIIPFLIFGQDLTYVPDDNFEQRLINLGFDDILDDYVLTENINNVSDLNVASQNIADLTGIEDFVSLQILECQYNQLTTLDVSNNVNLLQLVCFNNQLINLDVSQNTDLLFLQCSGNQLTNLDLSQNTSLDNLTCIGNYFTELNVSNNTFLSTIDARGNPLTSLDLSQNTALNWLFFDNTQITSIDLSQNTALTFLYCPNNQLTNLDVSNNFNLISLACQNNLLSTLDLRNGNNQNMAINSNWGNDHVNLTNNPNLFCIDVDDESWSNTSWTVSNGNIDSWANFSANCTTAIFDEELKTKKMIRIVDVLGRENIHNKCFQLHIYDDGSVEKKYLIK